MMRVASGEGRGGGEYGEKGRAGLVPSGAQGRVAGRQTMQGRERGAQGGGLNGA